MISLTPNRTGINDLSNRISEGHVSTSIRLKPAVYIFILSSQPTAHWLMATKDKVVLGPQLYCS